MTAWNKDPNLEDALRDALRREEAPEGFAAGVLARVAGQESAPREKGHWFGFFSFFSRPLIRWAAFAAVASCLIVGGTYYRNVRRERAEGEAAKQQLMLALRIAGNKLQLAKTKVHEINASRTGWQRQATSPRSRS